MWVWQGCGHKEFERMIVLDIFITDLNEIVRTLFG